MIKEHFKKADLINLPSCFLDPRGNFIYGGVNHEIGVHEEMAQNIVEDIMGEDFLEVWEKLSNNYSYTYQYLEEELGYWRYSHWLGDYGVFNGELNKMSFAQKLAIREFCKVNKTTWEDVVRD